MTATDDANRTPVRMGLPWWLLPLALLQLAGCALTCAGGIEYEINSTVVWLWESWPWLA